MRSQPHYRVRVVVVAAAVVSGTQRDDSARLGHLVVDLAQRRRHLVAQRAGDDHHVRLARRWTEHNAEAVEVIAGCPTCVISTAQQAMLNVFS
jgi:hypothetical protein